MIGQHKSTLNTPCLVIDKDKLLQNINDMQAFALKYHKSVRPHAKTHKCTEIAKLQKQQGAIGICATKVSEALVLAEHGITGILITSPVVTENKLNMLSKVYQLAPDTMVVCDSFANAEELNQFALNHLKQSMDVIVDIDAGIGRTGVSFEHAIALARHINELSHLNLKGIQCYAGHFQHISGYNKRQEASSLLLKKAGEIKAQIEAQTGLKNLIQTGSGTGTYAIDCNVQSVTEIQPGSYTVMDKEYFDIESINSFLPAMTLLSTVISANHETHVTVDAGLKALYKDPTKPQIISHDDLYYDWDYFGDEHGKVTGNPLPKLGDIIEMVVPHCDPTINLFDQFYITENDIVTDVWPINLRGKSQ